MNDWAGGNGGSGGSSTPQPTVEYETVKMDTASVKAFGDALIKDADNMGTASKDIRKQLDNPTDPSDSRGLHSTYPVGADPRQETLHRLVVEHSQRMGDTHALLDSARSSIHNTGLICKMIATQFGDVDALNATSVDEIKSLLGEVPEAEPPKEH